MSRRRFAPLVLAAALGLTGCGDSGTTTSSDSLTPQAVIQQVASKTQEAGSSKFAFSTTVDAGGQEIELGGEGAFALDGTKGQLSLEIPGGLGTVEVRVLDGTAYLKVPGQPGWLAASLEDLAGSSFGSSADPTSALETLGEAATDLREDGTATVRGESCTRYAGTFDYEKAAAAAEGATKAQLEKASESLTSTTIPFTACIDDEGRMRQLTQDLALEQDGQKGTASVTLEFYDFGTAVDVVAPPASEVTKDSPILDQLLAA
jgi:hypothetical protein